MFTGIVTAIGMIEAREERGDLRLRIACPFDPDKIAIGASIACSGVCLTVVERGGEAGKAWFAVDVSAETQARTAPGMWTQGTRLNLERALKVGDELGGHIVTGHVDGIGIVEAVEPIGDSTRIAVAVGPELAPYLAAKGSIRPCWRTATAATWWTATATGATRRSSRTSTARGTRSTWRSRTGTTT